MPGVRLVGVTSPTRVIAGIQKSHGAYPFALFLSTRPGTTFLTRCCGAFEGSGTPLQDLQKEFSMVDFLIGLAFVAMIFTPAIVASIQRTKSQDGDL